jgi:hypothetical protein
MAPRSERATRDRALWMVRLATFGSAAGALGLSWVFSDASQAYFSGKPAPSSAPVVPAVPVAAAPVQAAPPVIQTVVHHPYQGSGYKAPAPAAGGSAAGASAPKPPAQGPAAPPPPPPPPVCHSTPSKPC